ncbi:MAG: ParB/Srx family N-terminal domain-containing protein [SAR324 cluster bacterium]|nr:ParB/Srx family N-terminal domain-containing protein [SAR324 cluster bacterium]
MKITPAWDNSILTADQIETVETPFNWFPGALSENDNSSIKQNGILLPLLVKAVRDSKYLLVDGFKRFSCRATQTEISNHEKQTLEFSCIVLPDSLSMKEVAGIRLHTLAAAGTAFSGLHVCRMLKNLLLYGFEKDKIVLEVLPRLGLKPSVRLLRQLLDLQEMLEVQEQQFRQTDFLMSLGCEDLLPLLKFSQNDFATVVGLAEKMEVSGKKWRNLLQVLDEVCRLKQTSAVEVLKFPEILEIFGRSSLQAPVRYRLLKQQLDSWRYPELSDLRQRFEQGRQRLKLTPRMSLESEAFFENDDLTLTLKIRSYEELLRHLKYLEHGAHEFTAEKSEELWNDLFAVLLEE